MIAWKENFKIDVPNACFDSELSLLCHICQELVDPCVVELGPMFGGSTLAMLRGLENKGMLHSFDWFRYSPWMNDILNRFKSDYPLSDGDSFYDIFLENTKGYDNLKSYIADLSEPQIWIESIDLLVVDAIKKIKIALQTVPVFFPKVKVGGWIFDQDIRFTGHHYEIMHSLYYMLRESLVPHTYPHPGTGILFEVKEPIEINIDVWLAQDQNKALSYITSLRDECMKSKLPIL